MSTQESKVSFMHLRPTEVVATPTGDRECPATKGGTTIAYKVEASAGETAYVVSYAFASCHPIDNYSRVQGRAKAAGRLQSTRFAKTFTVTDKDTVIKTLTETVKKDLMARFAQAVLPTTH